MFPTWRRMDKFLLPPIDHTCCWTLSNKNVSIIHYLIHLTHNKRSFLLPSQLIDRFLGSVRLSQRAKEVASWSGLTRETALWHWIQSRRPPSPPSDILWAHAESIAQAINILSDTKCYIFINTTSNDLLPIFSLLARVSFIISPTGRGRGLEKPLEPREKFM